MRGGIYAPPDLDRVNGYNKYFLWPHSYRIFSGLQQVHSVSKLLSYTLVDENINTLSTDSVKHIRGLKQVHSVS